MKAFTRKSTGEAEKPTSMVYDGENGLEVVEWSRDQDTNARFQYRPELPDEPARVRLEAPYIHWEVVPTGSTISLDEDGNLVLTLPEPETEEDVEDDDTAGA